MSSGIMREGCCRKAKTYGGGGGMLAVEGLEKLACSNWPNGAYWAAATGHTPLLSVSTMTDLYLKRLPQYISCLGMT
jgi:hypothetical protein